MRTTGTRVLAGLSAILLAPLLLAPADARADVDLEIRNGTKVTSTFDSADEAEVFRFTLPAGTKLTIVLQGRKRKGAARGQPRFNLEGPNLGQNDLGGDALKEGKNGVKLRGFVVPSDGEYRLTVTNGGDRDTDYQLVAKWSVPKRTKLTGTIDGDSRLHAVPVLDGARLDALVKRKGKSDMLPRFVGVLPPLPPPPDIPPAAEGSKKHKIRIADLAGTGELILEVGSDEPGDYAGFARVKVKKQKPAKVAVTDRQIGGSREGGNFAVGAVVGPEGRLIEPGEGAPIDLGGSSLLIPPGALPTSTPVVIGTAQPITEAEPEPEGDPLVPVGPTVFFGPEGQVFEEPVTVTIPFDPDALPDGDVSVLRIVERQANGNERTFDPDDSGIDAGDGTASFPVSHFTSFRAFAPAGPPPGPGGIEGDLIGTGVATLVVRAPLTGDDEGRISLFEGADEPPNTTVDNSSLDFVGEMGTTLRLGSRIAFGDVDQDGKTDLLVSAPGSGTGPSEMTLYYGADTLPPVDGGGGPFGERRSLFFGNAPAGQTIGGDVAIGDLTGDGAPDIVHSGTQFPATGVVRIIAGGTGTPSGVAATVTLGSGSPTLGFGHRIVLGDFDGDDQLDLAVSDIDQGQVTVFKGPIASGQVTFDVLRDVQFSATLRTTFFGASLAAGDVDGDGDDDLVVGHPMVDSSAPVVQNVGEVLVLHGGSGFFTAPDTIDTIPGPGEGGAFGTDVACLDLDGDDKAELLASGLFANRFDTGVPDGYVTYFPGGPTRGGEDGFSITAELDTALCFFEPLFDVDGGGNRDILIYAPRTVLPGDTNQPSGSAFLLLGENGTPTVSLISSLADGRIDGQGSDRLGETPLLEDLLDVFNAQ